MRILEFIKQFPGEESCKAKWKEIREKQGIVCPECGSREHYWKKDKECFECKHCHYRQSLRANTIMHGSHLSFQSWFMAFHLLTCTKKSFSALEIQRQIGHKNYMPIWALVHKIRSAMGKRDDQYKLHDSVEIDEGFFSTEIPLDEKDDKRKRGRGSQRKSMVMVMAESLPVDEKPVRKGQKPTRSRYIKMKLLTDLRSGTVEANVKERVDKDSKALTDCYSSYGCLGGLVREHETHISSKETVKTAFPWVHIAISNAKRLITDVHHDVQPKFLQYYLDEFCYKFNRRYFRNLFERLLIASVGFKNKFRYN